MLTYIFRAISATFAALYAILSVGLASVPQEALVEVYHPVEDVPKEKTGANVHILQNRSEIGFLLQQAVDLYSLESGNAIRFSVQTIGGASDYGTTLRTKLLSGEDAELFQFSGARELLELSPYIKDLTSALPWLTQAYSGALDTVSREDRVFGVPYSIEVSGFICNRDIFDAADISLPEITSFDDFSEAFALLNEKIISGDLSEDFPELEAVCEFPAGDKSFLCSQFADIALSGSFAAPLEAALASGITFPAAEQTENLIKLMARFSASRSDWTKLNTISQNLAVHRFATQRVAVILQDSNVYARVNELNPKLQGRLFLLPVPLETFELPCVYAGVPAYWAVNATAEESAQKAAADFLTWLYRSDEGTEILAGDFGLFSPFQDTAKDTGAALHAQMRRYLEAKQTLPQLHNDVRQDWLSGTFAPNVQSYFAQRDKTWEEVIAACTSGWDFPDSTQERE